MHVCGSNPISDGDDWVSLFVQHTALFSGHLGRCYGDDKAKVSLNVKTWKRIKEQALDYI